MRIGALAMGQFEPARHFGVSSCELHGTGAQRREFVHIIPEKVVLIVHHAPRQTPTTRARVSTRIGGVWRSSTSSSNDTGSRTVSLSRLPRTRYCSCREFGRVTDSTFTLRSRG